MKKTDKNITSEKNGITREEREFLLSLRRLKPQPPPPRLESRIFPPRRLKILREPSWAAALLLLALSLAALLFQARSRIPSSVLIGSSLVRSSTARPGLELLKKHSRLLTEEEK
jgi:hypothetical protein